MSKEQRIALVTGGNRGIGLAVCRQLAQQGLQVILTSRDEHKGQAAAKQIKGAVFHPLDVTQAESITQVQDYIQREFGRLDVLVNNAAVNLDDGYRFFDVPVETYRATMEANLYGPLMLCHTFVPLMKHHKYGRIVNVSSEMGQFAYLDGGTPAYSLSKTALNGLTAMLAGTLRGTGILVNACCPGWVHTDMGGPDAPLTPEEGADTIVWLATLPNNGPSGGFFQKRQRLEW